MVETWLTYEINIHFPNYNVMQANSKKRRRGVMVLINDQLQAERIPELQPTETLLALKIKHRLGHFFLIGNY